MAASNSEGDNEELRFNKVGREGAVYYSTFLLEVFMDNVLHPFKNLEFTTNFLGFL